MVFIEAFVLATIITLGVVCCTDFISRRRWRDGYRFRRSRRRGARRRREGGQPEGAPDPAPRTRSMERREQAAEVLALLPTFRVTGEELVRIEQVGPGLASLGELDGRGGGNEPGNGIGQAPVLHNEPAGPPTSPMAQDDVELGTACHAPAAAPCPCPPSLYSPEGTVDLDPEEFETPLEGELCVICTDRFARGTQVVVLPCSHVFHRPCITQWFVRKISCPVCRLKITPELLQHDAEGGEPPGGLEFDNPTPPRSESPHQPPAAYPAVLYSRTGSQPMIGIPEENSVSPSSGPLSSLRGAPTVADSRASVATTVIPGRPSFGLPLAPLNVSMATPASVLRAAPRSRRFSANANAQVDRYPRDRRPSAGAAPGHHRGYPSGSSAGLPPGLNFSSRVAGLPYNGATGLPLDQQVRGSLFASFAGTDSEISASGDSYLRPGIGQLGLVPPQAPAQLSPLGLTSRSRRNSDRDRAHQVPARAMAASPLGNGGSALGRVPSLVSLGRATAASPGPGTGTGTPAGLYSNSRAPSLTGSRQGSFSVRSGAAMVGLRPPVGLYGVVPPPTALHPRTPSDTASECSVDISPAAPSPTGHVQHPSRAMMSVSGGGGTENDPALTLDQAERGVAAPAGTRFGAMGPSMPPTAANTRARARN